MPETLEKKSKTSTTAKPSSESADSTKESKNQTIIIEGNEAVASVAFRINEVIAIYPITPSSGMGNCPTNGRHTTQKYLGNHSHRD